MDVDVCINLSCNVNFFVAMNVDVLMSLFIDVDVLT